MATDLEYMQMSTNVYAASDKNYVGAPSGWTRLDWVADDGWGFSAGAYIKDGTNEIVIAYAGTNEPKQGQV
jgi:hypothetical protein